MKIIFHHPLPLDPNAKSASGIRPLKMLRAFQSLGIEVTLVTGYSPDRKRAIARVKESILAGVEYSFVYSESSTMPMTLTDRHHLPLSPLLDFLFFRFCRKKEVPIGLFYRDIYWLFDGYGHDLSLIKNLTAKAAYSFDLWVYNKTLDKLYLPSVAMGAYVPRVNPAIFEPLPPGHTSPRFKDTRALPDRDLPLRLFYVGGMSAHYQMHKLFKVVRNVSKVELTVCTRENEWCAVAKEYPALAPNIRVIHKVGADMERELQNADVAVLFVKPQEYWEFAAPVKLYEYLGHGKPILASEGTLAGAFVQENGIGWTIPYEERSLSGLLERLAANPSLLQAKMPVLEDVAVAHSWEARARKVVKDLVP